jgi:hypothetical protein
MSKGEDKLIKIFNFSRVQYNREVIVPRLTGKKGVPLRYDFGIYNYGALIALIEFDGEQHFKYTSHFNKSQSDFQYRRGCDRKKNEWALNNKVPLYRIPYWDLDELNSFTSLFQNKYLVTSIYHNDRLIREKFGGM